MDLEDELWTEGRPALPATPAWLLPKEYAGFSPAEKLGQAHCRSSLSWAVPLQLVGKLDGNLAWLLNLRRWTLMPLRRDLLLRANERHNYASTARVSAGKSLRAEANGVELAEYDDVLTVLAAQTEEQTVLDDPASVNYAVYQTLQANPALTVKDEADPLLPMKGASEQKSELAPPASSHPGRRGYGALPDRAGEPSGCRRRAD